MKILENMNGYDIVDETKEGYIHVEPLPSDEELKNIYKDEYFNEEKKDYLTNATKDLDWLNTIYADKYEIFNQYTEVKNPKILDIGCGNGYFLKYGEEIGWDCFGIEPSKVAAQYAKEQGLNVINTVFEKKLFSDNSFDVINMDKVLEHLPRPEDILLDAHMLLKKDGVICISVPNDFSPLQNILSQELGYKKWWLSPPHHLNYFSKSSLQGLLERCGYKIVLEEGTFPMELFLLMGDNYIEDGSLGRKMHQKRKLFDMHLSKHNNRLKRELYQSLIKLGIGREVVLYAQKVS